MKDFLAILATASIGLLIFLGVAALVGGVCLLPSLVAWLLWNHAIAPACGWPHAGFWLVFAVLWVASIVGRTIFGHK